MLKINRSTLYRLAANGQIPFLRTGTEYRFDREQIDGWRFAQQVKP